MEDAIKELERSESGAQSAIVDYFPLHNREVARSILWGRLPLSRVRKYLGIKACLCVFGPYELPQCVYMYMCVGCESRVSHAFINNIR